MTVITTFKEKQYKKKITFERKVLREISLSSLKKEFQNLFEPFFQYSLLYQDEIQDTCIDIAIEAYLQGAEYSRFGYYGESMEKIHERSEQSKQLLISSLFEYWQFWSYSPDMMMESLYLACDGFVSHWWREGFNNGQKRYRLRLN